MASTWSDPRRGETSLPEDAEVTMAAGSAGFIRIVTTVGERVFDAQFEASADDVGFHEVDEGVVHW